MKLTRLSPRLLFFVCLAAFLLSASSANAHLASGEAGGFASGFHHPWSGLDHILAMLAVGIWGAQLGAPAIWLLPVVFPMIMACGGFLGLIGVHIPGVEIEIALSALRVAGRLKKATDEHGFTRIGKAGNAYLASPFHPCKSVFIRG
jgi:hydrogenase/urease accessory protein HupE